MSNNLNVFFKEVYSEFTKIVWPSRKEFILNVLFTFLVVLFFAIYLGFIDGLVGYVMTKIVCYFV